MTLIKVDRKPVIRIFWEAFAPYVEECSSTTKFKRTSDCVIPGWSSEIADALMTSLGWPFDIVSLPEEFGPSTISGLFKYLQSTDNVCTYPGFFRTKERERLLTVTDTLAYGLEAGIFRVPINEDPLNFFGYLRVFERSTWVALLLCFTAFYGVKYMFGRVKEHTLYIGHRSSNVLVVASTAIASLVALYESGLLSTLLVSSTKPLFYDVSTLRDAVLSQQTTLLLVKGYANTEFILRSQFDEHSELGKLQSALKLYPPTLFDTDQQYKETLMSSPYYSTIGDLFVGLGYAKHDPSMRVRVLDDFPTNEFTMLCSPNLSKVLLQEMNEEIGQLRPYFDGFLKRSDSTLRLENRVRWNSILNENQFKSLTAKGTIGLFMVVLAGGTIALIALAAEILITRQTRKRNFTLSLVSM